jgi:hypothetical protein
VSQGACIVQVVVGAFREWRERRQHDRDEAQLFAAQDAWDESYAELSEFIKLAGMRGIGSEYLENTSVILRRSEAVVGIYPNVALVQPRVGPSHTVTNYASFSYQLSKKTRVRSGQYRSTHTPGTEAATPIDSGFAVITDQRVIFNGSVRTNEWDYRKVSGLINSSDEPWTSIAVSNRQKVSGIRYDWQRADDFRFHLAWGFALFRGSTVALQESLRSQLRELGRRPGDDGPDDEYLSEVAERPSIGASLDAIANEVEPAARHNALDDIADQIERGEFS